MQINFREADLQELPVKGCSLGLAPLLSVIRLMDSGMREGLDTTVDISMPSAADYRDLRTHKRETKRVLSRFACIYLCAGRSNSSAGDVDQRKLEVHCAASLAT